MWHGGKNTSYTLREKICRVEKKATMKSLIYHSFNNAVSFYYVGTVNHKYIYHDYRVLHIGTYCSRKVELVLMLIEIVRN